eukprot:5904437-Prymnesium_polylepis.1
MCLVSKCSLCRQLVRACPLERHDGTTDGSNLRLPVGVRDEERFAVFCYLARQLEQQQLEKGDLILRSFCCCVPALTIRPLCLHRSLHFSARLLELHIPLKSRLVDTLLLCPA